MGDTLYSRMSTVLLCPAVTKPKLPGPKGPVLVLQCRREDGHEGEHCAVWHRGWISWEEVQHGD